MSSKKKPVTITKNDLSALRISDAAEIFGELEKKGAEVYGGSADILKLDVSKAAGPLLYEGIDEKKLELDGDKVDVHVGRDGSGKRWRLPLSTSFRNQIEDAKLTKGDTFYIRRLDDVLKKKGKGKGNPMKIFQIAVSERAAVTA